MARCESPSAAWESILQPDYCCCCSRLLFSGPLVDLAWCGVAGSHPLRSLRSPFAEQPRGGKPLVLGNGFPPSSSLVFPSLLPPSLLLGVPREAGKIKKHPAITKRKGLFIFRTSIGS